MQDLHFLIPHATLDSTGYHIDASGLSTSAQITALTTLMEQNEVQPVGHPNYPAPSPWSMLQLDYKQHIWRIPRAWATVHIAPLVYTFAASEGESYICGKNPFDQPMELRTGQVKAFNFIRHHLSKISSTGIAQLPTAWGKSCLGIFLARDFYENHVIQCVKRPFRVLIVVTTTEIGDEWRKTIAMFCSNAAITQTHSKKKKKLNDSESNDIPYEQSVISLLDGKHKQHRTNPHAMFLIATVQTLARLPLSTDVEDRLQPFDFTIYDEAHHFGAELFSQVNYAAHGARILGLSATPNREDGMEKVLHHHLGPIFYREEVSIQPSKWTLHLHSLNFEVKVKQCYVPQRQRMEETFNAKIKALSFCEERNRYIAQVLLDTIEQHPLRRIVAFSLLKAPVYTIANQVQNLLKNKRSEITVSTYTGDDKKKGVKLQDVLSSHLILTTYSMFGEGISCEQLNGMVVITGLAGAGKMEQPLGRSLRKPHEEIDVVVIDFDDHILPGLIHNRVRQYKARMGEKGLTIRKWVPDSVTKLPILRATIGAK